MTLNQALVRSRCQDIEDSLHRLEKIRMIPIDEFLMDRDSQDIACAHDPVDDIRRSSGPDRNSHEIGRDSRESPVGPSRLLPEIPGKNPPFHRVRGNAHA